MNRGRATLLQQNNYLMDVVASQTVADSIRITQS